MSQTIKELPEIGDIVKNMFVDECTAAIRFNSGKEIIVFMKREDINLPAPPPVATPGWIPGIYPRPTPPIMF